MGNCSPFHSETPGNDFIKVKNEAKIDETFKYLEKELTPLAITDTTKIDEIIQTKQIIYTSEIHKNVSIQSVRLKVIKPAYAFIDSFMVITTNKGTMKKIIDVFQKDRPSISLLEIFQDIPEYIQSKETQNNENMTNLTGMFFINPNFQLQFSPSTTSMSFKASNISQ